MGLYIPNACTPSENSERALIAGSVGENRTRCFAASANKAFVWRRCGQWAIEKGPVALAACLASHHTEWMWPARSIGVDRTRFRFFDDQDGVCRP